MSDADTFVAIGDAFTGSDAATYFETRNEALIAREQAGEFDDGGIDEFIAAADFSIDVDQLVRIARAAADFVNQRLSGNMEGAYELPLLTQELRGAGLLDEDTLNEMTFLEGEGQTGV